MQEIQQVQIPKRVYELSEDMKIIWYGRLVKGNPWENITGKLEIGRQIDVEKMLKEKGFESANKYF